MNPSSRFSVLLCLTLALTTGCGTREQTVYTVQGRLLVDDQPAVNASIAFHPIGDRTLSKVRPVGKTGLDGSYQLTTRVTNDGAPPGEYVVTIVWPDDSIPLDECDCNEVLKHDRFGGLYADSTKSTLRAVVRSGSNEVSFHEAMPSPPNHQRGRQTRKSDDWFATPWAIEGGESEPSASIRPRS